MSMFPFPTFPFVFFVLYSCCFFGHTNAITDHFGFMSNCTSTITYDQFVAAYNDATTCKSFYGNVYNGALVSVLNTDTGICAGINTFGTTSLQNSKTAGNNAVGRNNDAIHIPRYMLSASITIKAPKFICWGKANSIKCQAYCPIYQINKDCPANCIGRVWIWVSPYTNSQWDTDPEKNRVFLQALLSYYPGLGPQVGIVTRMDHWSALMPSNYIPTDGNNNIPAMLWADCSTNHYDYTGYVGFAGWQSPSVHRYTCDVSNVCNSGTLGDQTWFGTIP